MADESFPFAGTVEEWETLADDHGLCANIISTWKGHGTALLVVSLPDGSPVPSEKMEVWKRIVRELTPVGARYTTVSVG